MKYVYLSKMAAGQFRGELMDGKNVAARIEELETPIESKAARFELIVMVGSSSHDEMESGRVGDARECKIPISKERTQDDRKVIGLIQEAVEYLYRPDKPFQSIPARKEESSDGAWDEDKLPPADEDSKKMEEETDESEEESTSEETGDPTAAEINEDEPNLPDDEDEPKEEDQDEDAEPPTEETDESESEDED